ncbi:zinc finger protein 668-like [Homarus americanus]|uniref:Zinc finger protein 250-like n=1 Tax=Homarus americanus TaxID=6706 RepID=A0A8J5T218_HOMAM|nr:zinc finger protein 668-like [Homarus americanus]XP_042216490.1 zinc finger protein 668-like [Homarus americanus]KAG7171885.1 Zinc finger protein 250-like [Homarus americanus]
MATSLEDGVNYLCIVCNLDVKGAPINIHSNLAAKNGSIHSLICQVVNYEDLLEACQSSEVICARCLKILLNIVNLECKIINLRNDFRETFQNGIESRRVPIGESLMNQVKPRHLPDEEKIDVKICNSIEWGEGPGCQQEYQANNDKTFVGINEKVFDITDSSKHDLLSVNGLMCEKKVPIKFEASNNVISIESEHCIEISNNHMSFSGARDLNELIPPRGIEDNPEIIGNSLNDEADQSVTFKRSCSESALLDCPSSPASGQHLIDPLKDSVESEYFDEQSQDIATKIYPASTEKQKEIDPLLTDLDNLEVKMCLEDDVKNSTSGRRKRTKPTQPQQIRLKRPKRYKRKKILVEGTEVKTEMEPEEESDLEDSLLQVQYNMITCELCGERFGDSRKLAKHGKNMHASVYCYVCDQCTDIRYREKAKLTQHLRRIHKVSVHQCQACDHEASSQRSLDQHIISNHPDSRFFECHICHKAFRTHRYLHFAHIKRCHFGLPVKYTCEKCKKGFVDKSSFENHKVIHSKAKNYTCEFCGAMFYTSYTLKTHVNTHTQEKKYVCGDCGSAFLRFSNLIAHKKRLHSSDDLKLVCEICGKSMLTQRDLRRHQLAHHSKERSFTCHQCPRSYTAKDSLRSHLRTHAGEKPDKDPSGKVFHKNNLLCHRQQCVPVGDEFQQDIIHTQDTKNTVQVSGEEIEGGEHMVVITLKECQPPAVYTVRNAQTHLQEIMVSSETPSHTQSGSIVDENLPLEGTGLPLLHSQLGTIGTGRIGLSTPVLFTTLNTESISVQHGQDTISGGLSHSGFTTDVTCIDGGLQATPLTFQQTPVPGVQSKEQDSLASFSAETPVTCAPLTTQLIQLPPLQTSTANNAPVTFVATWPSAL